MNHVSIVTLTRFPDIFTAFAESVDAHELAIKRILVTSGAAVINRLGWEVVEGVEPFVWARNANLGILAAGESDVVLVNDDVQFLSPTIAELRMICDANQQIGVLSPQVIGGINNVQADARYPIHAEWIESSSPLLPFVCVYIPRRVIEMVGPFDESFTGYGGDDEDWCIRVRRCGFKLAITPRVKVRHGFGGREYSSTFFRTMTEQQRNESLAWSRQRVAELHR